MNEKVILEQLVRLFHQVFNDDSIAVTPETNAQDIPEWDSFHHITLIVATEAHFGIKFKTAEIEALKNIGMFVTLIHRKLNAK